MDMPINFITWESCGTLAGATTSVYFVTNALRKTFGWVRPLLPFIVSIAIVLGYSFFANQLNDGIDYLLAFFNSCLVFCTATGANETLVEGGRAKQPSVETYGAKPVKWTSSWLRSV